MRMIKTSFLDHLLQMVYDMFILILSVVVILIFLWIFVKIKRWYGKARIERTTHDFKETVHYIEKKGKGINWLQRVSLKLTGEIESGQFLKDAIIGAIIGALIAVLLKVVLGEDLVERILNKNVFWIFMSVYCIITELIIGYYWIKSIRNFVKHARILPLLIWFIAFVAYAFITYQCIKPFL